MENKKYISKPVTSKKIATLLSTGLVVLPLASCKAKQNIQQIQTEEPETQIVLCDTSSINLDAILNEYKKAYDNQTVMNGKEQMKYYVELYDVLKTTEENQSIKNDEANALYIEDGEDNDIDEVITYNFDGTELVYDDNQNNKFFINGELIKNISDSSVWLKTLFGEFEIKELNDSYCITNTNTNNSTVTNIEYSDDGNFSISESKNDMTSTYTFGSDGKLISSQFEKNIGYPLENTKTNYKNGDIDIYSKFNNYNDELVEQRYEDGSYILNMYNCGIDRKRLKKMSSYVDQGYDKITYFYDSKDSLQEIDASSESEHIDGYHSMINVKLLPNGDYYKYYKYVDNTGKIVDEEMEENKYNNYKSSVIKSWNDEKNALDVVVSKWDYNVLAKDGSKGAWTYQSRNGKVSIKQIDGVIYNYGEDRFGPYANGFKRDKDGITYYKAEGKKERFEDQNGNIKYYDNDNKIKSVYNKKSKTEYYDYDNNVIKEIDNKSNDEIEVEANGEVYKLNKGGKVTFYDNGNKEYYYYNDDNYSKYDRETKGEIELKSGKIYTKYDQNHKIIYINDGETVKEYYDYDQGLLKSVRADGVYTSYYDDGSGVARICNVDNEKTQLIDGYELNKHGELTYFHDGTGRVKTYSDPETSRKINYLESGGRFVTEDRYNYVI